MIGLTPEAVHGFSSSLLMKSFDEPKPTPSFHHELWTLCCSNHKKIAIAAPRGHAKSTAVTHTIALAAVLFRIKKHICIVSDIEGQSVLFLGDIKNELLENDELRELFKFDRLIKDSETEVIGRFQDGRLFRIFCKGSEQRLRGMKWRNARPDLILCDDLENDEIVMNEARRWKFRQWFFNALMPSGSDSCDVIVVGTILHMDSLLERLLPPLEDENLLSDGLKKWLPEHLTGESDDAEEGWFGVRYQAHNKEFSKVLWPEKYSKKRLNAIRRDYVDQGFPEGYSQEYLNYPIDEENAYFRREDLIPIPESALLTNGDYYAAADLAISEEDARAYTVVVVGKLVDERFLDIVDVRRFRGDSRRILDELFSIQTAYRPNLFGIEKENIARAIGPILNEEMGTPGKPFINIEELPPVKDKQTRGRSIQARVRAHTVRFDTNASWWPAFHQELTQFPRGKYADQVDAFAWIGHLLDKMADALSEEETEENEYEEEIEQAEQYGATGTYGRNRTTGY